MDKERVRDHSGQRPVDPGTERRARAHAAHVGRLPAPDRGRDGRARLGRLHKLHDRALREGALSRRHQHLRVQLLAVHDEERVVQLRR